jgi:hypothetical protein
MFGSVFALLVLFAVCQARQGIRQRDRIKFTEVNGQLTDNGCLEDCCCSFWCTLCTACQLMRHEGMVAGKYELCSADGSPKVV